MASMPAGVISFPETFRKTADFSSHGAIHFVCCISGPSFGTPPHFKPPHPPPSYEDAQPGMLRFGPFDARKVRWLGNDAASILGAPTSCWAEHCTLCMTITFTHTHTPHSHTHTLKRGAPSRMYLLYMIWQIVYIYIYIYIYLSLSLSIYLSIYIYIYIYI